MQKKRIIRLLSFGMVLCLLLGVSAFADETQRAPLSPAIEVLAQKTDLALWHLVGEEQSFSAKSFLRGLNLSSLESIRVTKLPNPLDGVLWLEDRPIEVGRTLSSSDLSNLTFSATSQKVKQASFAFEVNDFGL